MAEAVGIVASVLALTQTAWTVAKGLYDLADEVGTAGEAVRIFANDFWLFAETVKVLGGLLDSLPPVPTRTESTVEELLEIATEQVVQPFKTLLVELEPLLLKWRDSPSRMRQLGVRIQWAFSCKKKVLFYHAALNALKGNVSLLLQTLSLQGRNPPHVHFILYGSIQDTKARLKSGSSDRAPGLMLPTNQDTTGTDGRSIMSSAEQAWTSPAILDVVANHPRSRSQDEHDSLTDMAMVLVTDADDTNTSDDVNEITESLVGIALLAPEPIDNDEQIREERTEQLEAFGAIRAVQKKIIKLADEVTTAPASSLSQMDQATSGSAQKLKAEEDNTALQDAPSDEAIQFFDSLGSAFEIPYRFIRTWPAMHTFMIVDYNDVSGPDLTQRFADDYQLQSRIRNAVRQGEFTITYRARDTPEQIIFTHEWERSVKPGWTVQVVLDDDTLQSLKRINPGPPLRVVRKARLAAAEVIFGDHRGPDSPGLAAATGLNVVSNDTPPSSQGKPHKRNRSGLRSKLGL